MKVYDINDQEGRLVAFEVENGWLQPRGIRRLISALPGARVIAPRLAEEDVDGERLRFELAGILFLVVEPFGDNNRYWVGPEPQRFSETTRAVRTAFSDYQPALWFQLFRLLAGATLLGGCSILLALGFVSLPEAWAGLGAAGLVGGAIGILALVTVAVLGIAGASTRTIGQYLGSERHRGAG